VSLSLHSCVISHISNPGAISADCPGITTEGLSRLEKGIEHNFVFRYLSALPGDEKNPPKGRDFPNEGDIEFHRNEATPTDSFPLLLLLFILGNMYLERNARKYKTMEEVFGESKECAPFMAAYSTSLDMGG